MTARWLAPLRRSVSPIRRDRRPPANRQFELESLETRALLSAVTWHGDGGSDAFGNHFDTSPAVPAVLTSLPVSQTPQTSTPTDGTPQLGAPTIDPNQTFKLHSRPGANKVIYLDFNGDTTTGSYWNSAFTGGAAISTPAYDTDGNGSSFSTGELTNIQYIWQRVAEDYSPFDVDVTTEDPGSAVLTKANGAGAGVRSGIRVDIGGTGGWLGQAAGGVTYVGSFTWNSDTPAFVFPGNLGGGNEKYTAEAISHEVGHSLGLSHDGTSSTGYYAGQGSGETGWAPIMGVGYYQNLTQWSKGEYPGANNQQDDLTIITTQNGFGYRTDDVGNTTTSATAMTVSGNTLTASGVIERSTDIDVFSFTTAAGSVSLTASPYYRGPNLDVGADLYNASGTLVASASSHPGTLTATITANLPAGTYYMKVYGIGDAAAGFTNYASLGQYDITGTTGNSTSPPPASPPPPTGAGGTAAFVSSDTSSQGTWHGVRGTDGYALAGGSTSLPSYATWSLAGQQSWTWAGSTSDPRALQQPAPATDRLAATWYSSSSFTADLTLTGGSHRVGLYFLDWDSYTGGRSERVEVLDKATGAVLDTRTVSNFAGGTWLSWDISGAVTFRITNLKGGANAVLEGIFLGTGGTTTDTTGARITAATFSGSTTGTINAARLTFNEAIDPSTFTTSDVTLTGPGGAVTTVTVTGVTPVAGSGNTQFDVTFAAQSTAGKYTLTVGPDVRDLAGNQMDQNTNGANGEVPGDQYSASTTLTSPPPVSPPPPSGGGGSAAFAATDTSSQGTWRGVRGADGYSMAGGSTSLPSYATWSLAGQQSWTWAGSTSDPRALQQPAPATDRLAATWYSSSSFTADLTLTGGSHRVGLYFLDWDSYTGGRSERVEVLDKATGAVLDTRTVSNFAGGTWLSWDISGAVTFRITNLKGGANAVLEGIFLGTGGTTTDTTGARITAATFSGSTAGTINTARLTFNEAIDPSTFAAGDATLAGPGGAITVTGVTPVAGSGNTQFDVTFAAQSAAGTYTLTVGPDVRDLAGNQMDQNTNGANGEVPGDQYSASTTLTSPPPPNGGGGSATFVSSDTSSHGSWRGVRGADGYSMAGGSTSLPSYATWSLAGQQTYTWAGSTSDPRALQKPAPATDRLAATWYSSSSFTADLTLTGGSHRVGLYFLDWDSYTGGRSERVEVLDKATGAVLDTRTVSNFAGGTWLSWDISGAVTFRITNLKGGANAVLEGIFLGSGGSNAPAASPTVSEAPVTFTRVG